eukprot:TRINITY_DN741_c1_g1_i1.p1 TRINITY_DN741_c1_g1~~TRINITY_DN741_c1_g1_i1.p1  ORF type:complete len:866 (+),score=197.79 TRINITY_DN741_c1_g1_i1:57-2654(+)
MSGLPKPIIIANRKYEPTAVLGEGGYGVVYRARQSDGGEVALKRTCGLRDDTTGTYQYAQREAQLLLELTSQQATCVGLVYDAAANPTRVGSGEVLMVMKLYGESLAQRLRRKASRREHLSEDEVVRAAAACTSALAWMHRQKPPVAHRDVKPENLLHDRTSEWEWALCDFGSASADVYECRTRAQAAEAEDVIQTTTTFAYRAPEMVDVWDRRVGTKVDLWALGVLMYLALEQRLPFQDETPLAVLNARYPSMARTGLSQHAHAAVRSLLTIDVQKRPDAWEARRLLEAMASEHLQLPPMPPSDPVAMSWHDRGVLGSGRRTPSASPTHVPAQAPAGRMAKLVGMLDWSAGDRYGELAEGGESPVGIGADGAPRGDGLSHSAILGEPSGSPMQLCDTDIHAAIEDDFGDDFNRMQGQEPAAGTDFGRRTGVIAMRDWLERQRVLPTRGLALMHGDTPHQWVLRSTGGSPRSPPLRLVRRLIASMHKDPNAEPFLHYMSLRPFQGDAVVAFKCLCVLHECILEGPPEVCKILAERRKQLLTPMRQAWMGATWKKSRSPLPAIIVLYCEFLSSRMDAGPEGAICLPTDDESLSGLGECFSLGCQVGTEVSPPYAPGEQYFESAILPLWTDLLTQRKALASASRQQPGGPRWLLIKSRVREARMRCKDFVLAVGKHPPAEARSVPLNAEDDSVTDDEAEASAPVGQAPADLAAAFGPPSDFGAATAPASAPAAAPTPAPSVQDAFGPPVDFGAAAAPTAAPSFTPELAAAPSAAPSFTPELAAAPTPTSAPSFSAPPQPAQEQVTPDDIFGTGESLGVKQPRPQQQLNVDALFAAASMQQPGMYPQYVQPYPVAAQPVYGQQPHWPR